MPSLLLMNFLDIARSLGSNPLNARAESVAAFIEREFKGGGGIFNYNPSISLLPDLFRGAITVDQAVEYCSSHGASAGWKPNQDAIRLVGSYATTELSSCYPKRFSAVAVGRLADGSTAYMALKAPLVRVKSGYVAVVVPGFRLGHRPVGVEIDVAASLALATLGRDDFSDADYEYLDCSRGASGTRELQVYRGQDRTIFSLDQVDHLLDIYVRGLDLVIRRGAVARKPNFSGYSVIDPSQPKML